MDPSISIKYRFSVIIVKINVYSTILKKGLSTKRIEKLVVFSISN